MNIEQLVLPVVVSIFLVTLVVFVITTIFSKYDWKLSRNIAGSTLVTCELIWCLFGLFQRGQVLYAGVIAACFALTVGIIYLQVRSRK